MISKKINSCIKYTASLFILTVLTCTKLIAQQGEDESLVAIDNDEPILEAANRFKPRPKFFEINVVSFRDFLVEAETKDEGGESAQVSENLIREIKLKFPIILKENTNLFAGLGYRHEQFKFSDQTDPNFPLFKRFDDRSLKRTSFSLYFKRNLSEYKFLYMFLNSSLNSDKPGFDNLKDQLKLSITSLYGKKVSLHKQMGFGISFGYDFGEPAIFPVFSLNNDFALKWSYELLLPKSAKLRFSPTESDHIYSTLELQGASYHLRDSLLDEFGPLEFRRSSVRFTLNYEREIHDWLWVGATIGYRVPINIFISEPQARRRDALIIVNAQRAVYFNFSLFLVPPNKLYNKAKSSG